MSIHIYTYIYKSLYRYFFDTTVKSITRGINSVVVNRSCNVGRVPERSGEPKRADLFTAYFGHFNRKWDLVSGQEQISQLGEFTQPILNK